MQRPALAFSIALALTACKKDEAAAPPPPPPHADAAAARPVDAHAAPPAAAPDAGKPAATPDAAPAAAIDAGAKHTPPPPHHDAIDAGAKATPVDAAPAPPASPDAGATAGATPCHRVKFETKLIKDACFAGGQAAAKAAMKKFVAAHKSVDATLECKSCHEKLGPEYPLKSDGLDHFKKLGGA